MKKSNLPEELLEELRETMSLSRIVKDGFFVREEYFDPPSESFIKLNRVVLDRALVDHFIADKNYRYQSKLWRNLDNIEFVETCDRADLDSELVFLCFDVITDILLYRGEDKYFKEDNKALKKLTRKEKEFYLDYQEPDWDKKKRKKYTRKKKK